MYQSLHCYYDGPLLCGFNVVIKGLSLRSQCGVYAMALSFRFFVCRFVCLSPVKSVKSFTTWQHLAVSGGLSYRLLVLCLMLRCKRPSGSFVLDRLMGTVKPQSNGASRWLVHWPLMGGLCYIWYSEERPGPAAAPPSPFLAVPNVAAHPSTASVPTLYCSMWEYDDLYSLLG